MTRSRTFRKAALAVAATVTALTASACSVHPGSAAVVGDESISETRVDDVAAALCAAQAGGGQAGQPQDLASRAARQGALDVLIGSELSRQFGESQGVEPDQEQVSAALAANESNINGLPEEHRAEFRQALSDFAEGQLMLIEVGRKDLEARGGTNVTDQQAVARGTQMRNEWAKKNAEVSVDPRFGEFSDSGSLTGKSGSLSVPVSQRAADGDSPDPSAGWVASLPANQKCQ